MSPSRMDIEDDVVQCSLCMQSDYPCIKHREKKSYRVARQTTLSVDTTLKYKIDLKRFTGVDQNGNSKQPLLLVAPLQTVNHQMSAHAPVYTPLRPIMCRNQTSLQNASQSHSAASSISSQTTTHHQIPNAVNSHPTMRPILSRNSQANNRKQTDNVQCSDVFQRAANNLTHLTPSCGLVPHSDAHLIHQVDIKCPLTQQKLIPEQSKHRVIAEESMMRTTYENISVYQQSNGHLAHEYHNFVCNKIPNYSTYSTGPVYLPNNVPYQHIHTNYQDASAHHSVTSHKHQHRATNMDIQFCVQQGHQTSSQNIHFQHLPQNIQHNLPVTPPATNLLSANFYPEQALMFHHPPPPAGPVYYQLPQFTNHLYMPPSSLIQTSEQPDHCTLSLQEIQARGMFIIKQLQDTIQQNHTHQMKMQESKTEEESTVQPSAAHWLYPDITGPVACMAY